MGGQNKKENTDSGYWFQLNMELKKFIQLLINEIFLLIKYDGIR